MYQSTMWMVRAGDNAKLFNDFKNKGIVAIGWNEVGDLSKVYEPSEIKMRYKTVFPNEKEGNVSISVGQIKKFRFDLKRGDKVITYSPEKRIYLFGEVVDDYNWDTKLCEFGHIRKVKWAGEIPREKLSVRAKNILGDVSTVFEVNEEVVSEITNLMMSNEKPKTESSKTEGETKFMMSNEKPKTESSKTEGELYLIEENLRQRTHEFIKEQINNLSWYDAQRLVAGILRGMGYKTRIVQSASDMGKNIIASKDVLGLEEPKIIVEVRHKDGQITSKEIRNFIGGLRAGQKGIYICTDGFSKDAKYDAEMSTVPVALIEIEGLVELIIQHYDEFDNETRALIPLKKIYWPNPL